MNPKTKTEEHLPRINRRDCADEMERSGFFGGAGSPAARRSLRSLNDGAHGVTRPTLPMVVLHFIRVHLCASVVQFGFSG